MGSSPAADRVHASERRPRRRAVRGFGSVTLVGVVVILVIASSILALRPDLRRALTYRFESHTDSPSAVEFEPFLATDPPMLRLAAAGDVGTGGTEEFATAAAMDDLEADADYDALLLLGDNVYPDGAPSDVARVVLGPFSGVLDGRTQLLAVLGNHDIRNDNGERQAEALGMPNRWYSTEIGNTLVLSLDSNQPNDPDQLTWLAETLSASSATWKIAMLHHPPYSGGYHGSDIQVRHAFAPLFERHGVQLVLAGHDHDYQRSEPLEGVTYVVSGGAARLRPARKAAFSAVAWSTYHFIDIAIWTDRLELRAVDQSGAVFDSITLHATT